MISDLQTMANQDALLTLAHKVAGGEIHGREQAFHDEALRESAICALRGRGLAITEAAVRVIIDEVRRLKGLTEAPVPAVDPLRTAGVPDVSARFAATFPGAVRFAEHTRR